MKLLSLLFGCALISTSSVAQTAVASSDRNNILFAGIDNPLSIAVENTSNKSIVVKASSGSIVRNAEGKYIYTGSEFGEVEIIILRSDNGKLKEIRRIPFRVKPLPMPVAFLGGFPQGGSIKTKLAFPQGGIIAKFDDSYAEIDAPIKVVSYSVVIISATNCETKTIDNTGNRFNGPVSEALQHLGTNDRVIIKNILVAMPDGTKRQISPMYFTIEE